MKNYGSILVYAFGFVLGNSPNLLSVNISFPLYESNSYLEKHF